MTSQKGMIMEETREKQFHQRRNSLTEEDMDNLLSMFKAVIETRDNNHPCRFPTIDPEDLRVLVDTHRSLQLALNDTKKVIRRFFVIIFLSAATGLTVGGFWARIKQIVEGIVK